MNGNVEIKHEISNPNSNFSQLIRSAEQYIISSCLFERKIKRKRRRLSKV
jgi:hypothetical protein